VSDLWDGVCVCGVVGGGRCGRGCRGGVGQSALLCCLFVQPVLIWVCFYVLTCLLQLCLPSSMCVVVWC
jgi:hypothetical protein